jgi:Tol biopolymer transport system component
MSTLRIARGIAGGALALVPWTAPLTAQDTTRVSVNSSGTQGNGDSLDPAISADGEIVAFASLADNLVAGDKNRSYDVFVHDRPTGTTERVSIDSSGAEGHGNSKGPSISSDGRFVAFFSDASNLVSGDTNGFLDVFVHDRQTGTTERVSVDSVGSEGNSDSDTPWISADGMIVAFWSLASNLVSGDANGVSDIFVHDRQTGTTERISVDSAGTESNGTSTHASISADGQRVAFVSFGSNLVSGDTNGAADVFLHDRQAGTTERLSVDSAGTEANSSSYGASISADGQLVAFASFGSNLVSGDTNGAADVFVHDRATGTTELVSVDSTGTEGNSDSYDPSISADGQIVAFWSNASNLVSGDSNGRIDIFAYERQTGTTELVSVASDGTQGNFNSANPTTCADGHIVAFESSASNLVVGDTNGSEDVFIHELCITPASWSNYGAGFPGTNGVPSFTSQQNPMIGTTITLDLGNSYGNPTAGLLFVGFQRADLHSNWGGDLLVAPALVIPTSFSYGGNSYSGDLPSDWELCGFVIDLQAIEADPGAAKGVSFTPGLELLLGH